MNPASIHLMLTHVPVISSLLASAVLAWGLLRRQQEIVRLSLYLFVFAALTALPVYFSGEGAEESVEHLAGVAESLIEQHEDLAKLALILIESLGVLALGGLVLSLRAARKPLMLEQPDSVSAQRVLSFRGQGLPLWAAGMIGLVSLVNAGVLAQTAHLGGQIRHSEIRSDSFSRTPDQPGEGSAEAGDEQNPEQNAEHDKAHDKEPDEDHDDD